MAYSNKFVISILVNGQVQKEFANGEVSLTFGSEYAIRFRNKNDRQAVVKTYIDGEKMCRGGWVIPANSYRDIECSSQTLRKFKFVDLQSTEAQEHGKDQVNAENLMGVIEAHWYLEKAKPVVKEIHHHHPHPVPQPMPYPRPWDRYYPYATNSTNGITYWQTMGGGFESRSAPPQADAAVQLCSVNTAEFCSAKGAADDAGPVGRSMKRTASKSVAREGATVEGSHSSQRFGDISVDIEENATVLRLVLKGTDPAAHEVAQQDSAEVPLVKDGPTCVPKTEPAAETRYCDNCGAKVAKKSSRFCHQCGNKFD
jgi:hypothetical protein